MAYSSQDLQVQATNDDAASSKCSAIQLGYWNDPYLSSFVKPCARKPPEMNRGYYARVKAIESLVTQFLETTDCKCQVVNLGAGFDTSFWKLCDQKLVPVCWVDVDFENIVTRKVKTIRMKDILTGKLKTDISGSKNTEVDWKKGEVHSKVFHCVPCDLRDLTHLETTLKVKCGLNFDLPTLFISECVMVYMEAEESSRLVKWVADNFRSAMFVNYEQVDMGDRFGEVMQENLKGRGCGLVGVEHCSSLQSQLDRFLKNGWSGAQGADMVQIYHGMPTQELHRVEKIEFLDEMEVFEMLLRHYCVVWASLGNPLLTSIHLTIKK